MHQGLPEAGDIIAGKYTIERPLGRGGMGIVYVVSHRLTGKRMALKCLLPEFNEHSDIIERFVREAQAMGRIQHRHVVDVFDVGRDGEVLYIVMELLEGKLLSDLLHDEAMTLEETLGIALRAMEGVAAAHSHGIIHRDLKPDNVFVCVGTSGRLDDPRVLDFGISRLDDGNHRLTKSGVAMGTPYYMSLEQMSGNRDIDQRVDVYAMGVILYEAIAGQPPYTADSVSALAIRVLTTPPVHLGQWRPDLPAGLADVVMTAIARDRDQRYPSMTALIEALRPYVPRGAGLLVAEGQGRPLRTPRDARALGPSSDATLPAMVGTPRELSALPAPVQFASVVSASPVSPSKAVPVASESPVKWLVIGALSVLVLGLGAFVYLSRSPASDAALPRANPPAPPTPTATPAAARIDPPALAPAPTPVRPRPAQPGTAELPSAEPKNQSVQEQAASVERARAEKKAAHDARAKPPSEAASERSNEAPPTKSPEPSVRGRAGALAPDEF